MAEARDVAHAVDVQVARGTRPASPLAPERTPEHAPERTPEHAPERTPEHAPEHTPERTPEHAPERTREHAPVHAPEHASEHAPPGSAGAAPRGPATARASSPPPWGGAAFHWAVPGQEGGVLLDPAERGPVIVPVAAHGASVATALVEALDRAAERNANRLEVRRGEATVLFERSPGWPTPPRAPSEIVAGGPGPRTRAIGFAGSPLIEQARETLGHEGIATLREYPRLRRELAGRRRRTERALSRGEAAIRRGGLHLRLFKAGSAAALGMTLVGAAAGAGGLGASAALVFALGCAAIAAGARRTAALEVAQAAHRAVAAEISRREERLEREARRLAGALGSRDPLELADRLAVLEAEEARAMTTEAERQFQHDLALRLAARLDVAADGLVHCGAWQDVRTADSTSWPADVACVDEGQALPAIAGMARLLTRVEHDLPLPWPVVLWEPWPGARPDERARRLLVLAEHAPGRRVIAFVRA